MERNFIVCLQVFLNGTHKVHSFLIKKLKHLRHGEMNSVHVNRKKLQTFSALVYICQFTVHNSTTDHQNQRLLIISHFRLVASYDVAIPLDNFYVLTLLWMSILVHWMIDVIIVNVQSFHFFLVSGLTRDTCWRSERSRTTPSAFV